MEKTKMQRYVETLLWGFIGLWLVVTAYGWLRDYPGYDDTDDVVNGVRSEMRLHTDYGTGCQYLSTFLGGVTPRLDADGNHVCKGEGKWKD
jgi:hypothetical protein